MSEADPDVVTVSDEQVTVRKSLETEQFETLAIVFEIQSDHTEPTRIQVADAIPDDIPLDDIGFHPNYGAEHWAIDDRTVVFEREFSPGEEFTTIYGVRDVDDPDDAFLEQPTIELLDGVDVETGRNPNIEAISDIVSEEHSQIVRDVITGQANTMPGVDAESTPAADAAEAEAPDEPPDEEPATAEEEVVEPLEEPAEEPAVADASGPMAESSESAEPEIEEPEEPESAPEPDASATAADHEPPSDDVDVEAAVHAEFSDDTDEEPPSDEADDEITVPVTGGVARVLAKELREGTISAEDRRLLREELSTGEGSTEARIRHLQNEVSDLTAYTDAIEAFLDDEGPADEIIDDLRDDVNDLRSHVNGEVHTLREEVTNDLSELQAVVDDLRETVTAFTDRLETTESTVEQIEASLATIRDDIADVREETDRLDAVDAELDSLADRVGTVRSDLDQMSEFRDRLISAVGNPNDPDE